MLFLMSFALFSIIVSATGFLMFAFPAKYGWIITRYYSMMGFGKPADISKYHRWYFRLAGLFLFLASFTLHYEFWIQLRHILRR